MNKEQNHSQDTETKILQAAEKEFFEKSRRCDPCHAALLFPHEGQAL